MGRFKLVLKTTICNMHQNPWETINCYAKTKTDIDIWIQKELVQSLGFLRPYQFQLESISTWWPPFVGFLCVYLFRSSKLPPVQKLHFFTFLKVIENIRGATCISDANYFLSWKLPPVRSCSFKAPTKCSYGDFQGRGACRSW